jgi:hypothetical protein
MGGAYITHEEMRDTYNILIRKLQGKRPYERTGVDGRIILSRIQG